MSMRPVIFIFPGQGSQYVGMGKDLYDKVSSSRLLLEDITNREEYHHLPPLMWEGPEEELTRTDNVQPAITLVSLMALEAVKSQFPELWDRSYDTHHLVACAGHSLGEYAAHYAAGNLTSSETMNFVLWRGFYMNRASQPPYPAGGMIAILGMNRDQVHEVIAEFDANKIAIANLNTPNQIILSGEKEVIEKAGALALERGAKRVVQLKVSGAWHSPLMEPAREDMREIIERIINPTHIPPNPHISVVANVTADVVKDIQEWRYTLIDQITSPVRWVESVGKLKEIGAALSPQPPLWVEIGPGKVLKGLLLNIDRSSEVINIEDTSGLEALNQALKKG